MKRTQGIVYYFYASFNFWEMFYIIYRSAFKLLYAMIEILHIIQYES